VRDLSVPEQRHPEKAHRADSPQPKKPDWIRVKAPVSQGYKATRDIIRAQKLVTVCEEAGCPNVGECWSQGHATMMIMGEICTRGCTFCNVATGKPQTLDAFEPGRVAHAVAQLGLKHVVVTSVDRDDLEDGGADHFAQTIRAKNIFAQMLHDDEMIDNIQFQIYNRFYKEYSTDYKLDGIVYIDADADVCFRRISNRARAGESGIELSYLEKCKDYHDNWLLNKHLGTSLLRINANEEVSYDANNLNDQGVRWLNEVERYIDKSSISLLILSIFALIFSSFSLSISGLFAA
jgi:hypothetical protein